MFTTFGVDLKLDRHLFSLQIHSPAFQQSPASPHFLSPTTSNKWFSVLRAHTGITTIITRLPSTSKLHRNEDKFLHFTSKQTRDWKLYCTSRFFCWSTLELAQMPVFNNSYLLSNKEYTQHRRQWGITDTNLKIILALLPKLWPGCNLSEDKLGFK